LYLGLTVVRQGDRQSGLREIEAGMKGISGFLDYITTQFAGSFGRFWDPGGNIRKTVDINLATIARGDIDWPTLISSGEALALNFEREADRARLDEERDMEMENRR